MRTALKLLLVALLSCVSAGAQTAVISGQAINQYGQPVPFASVRVCSVTAAGIPCSITTPPITIYADYNLTVPIANPATTDQYGNYVIYVGALAFPNLYQVQLTPAPGITWTQVYNGPFLSAAPGSIVFAGSVTATLFNATTFPYYEINGTQIDSTVLSDDSNIAKLNANNTFTSFGLQTMSNLNATNQVNSTNGYRVNNFGGNLGQCLASDGTRYNTAVNCVVSGSLFYQTLQLNTVPQTQEPVLNFSSKFTLSTGSGVTNVDLAATSLFYQTVFYHSSPLTQRASLSFGTLFNVTDSGSTTLVNLLTTGSETELVTSSGAGSNGTCAKWNSLGGLTGTGVDCAALPISTRNCGANGCYFIMADGTIVQWGSVAGCTDSDGSHGCTAAVTFPVAFSTTSGLNLTTSCDWATRNCDASSTGRTISGFTMNLAAFVFVGGAGSHLDSTETADWIAIGH